LGIPLVIHGGTGLSDDQFRNLIANGVSKINYYTALADVAGARIRNNAAADACCGYTGIVKGIQAAMCAEIERCMEVWGSAGQADAVLGAAEAWRPVQHVIMYNVNGKDDTEVVAMMHKGKRVLSRIPGVRRVITGTAVPGSAKYQYSWLIEFVHEKVIDSYRDDPVHVDFADKLFRPIACDRISIDYLES